MPPKTPSKCEFTPVSEEEFERFIEVFRKMFIAKTRISAYRDRSDNVQQTHVVKAWDLLVNKPHKSFWSEFFKILGGGLIGASLSGLPFVIDKNDKLNIMIFIAMGFVGFISGFIGIISQK